MIKDDGSNRLSVRIFSQSEYKEQIAPIISEKKQRKILQDQETPAHVKLAQEKIESERVVYKLFFPDNPKDNYYTGVYRVEHNGKMETLAIDNGVITTTNREIKELLIQKGFIFMYQLDKEQEG